MMKRIVKTKELMLEVVDKKIENLGILVVGSCEDIRLMGDKIDSLEKRVENLDKKVGDLDKRVECLDKKVGDLDKKVENLDRKLSGQIIGLEKEIKNIDKKLDEKYSDIFNLVDGLAIEIRDGREHRLITSNQIIENEERIGRLETKVFGSVGYGTAG